MPALRTINLACCALQHLEEKDIERFDHSSVAMQIMCKDCENEAAKRVTGAAAEDVERHFLLPPGQAARLEDRGGGGEEGKLVMGAPRGAEGEGGRGGL